MNTPLPPQGPHGPDDDLPDDAGLAALYRKLPQNEPSAALDAAILHAAAQAIAATDATDATELPQGERRQAAREPGDWVRPKPHGADTPNDATRTTRAPRHRSLVALASAASLVLVAGLAWHMREMPTAQPEASAAAPAVGAPSVANESAAATPQLAASKTAEKLTPDQRDASAAGVVAAKPAMRAMTAPVPEISQNVAATPSPVSASVVDSAAEAQATGAAKATAAAPMKDQAMDKQAETTGRAAKREAKTYPPAPPATPAPVAELSAAAPTPSPPAAAPPPVAEVSAAPAMPSPEPTTVASAPQGIVGSAATTEDSKATSEPDIVSPEASELIAIRKLFATHHEDEAQQRLQNFHRQHPQWPLPADLQARLREP